MRLQRVQWVRYESVEDKCTKSCLFFQETVKIKSRFSRGRAADGRNFQALMPARYTTEARGPNVTVCSLGTSISSLPGDRRCCRPRMDDSTGCSPQSSIGWTQTDKPFVDQGRQFESDSLTNGKPMQISKDWSDIVERRQSRH